jgi:hypothetical protein
MSCHQRPEYRASHHRELVKWRNLKWPQVGDFGWPSGDFSHPEAIFGRSDHFGNSPFLIKIVDEFKPVRFITSPIRIYGESDGAGVREW